MAKVTHNVTTEDGKYNICLYDDGRFDTERHGEPWGVNSQTYGRFFNVPGNRMLLSFLDELVALRERVKELKELREEVNELRFKQSLMVPRSCDLISCCKDATGIIVRLETDESGYYCVEHFEELRGKGGR